MLMQGMRISYTFELPVLISYLCLVVCIYSTEKTGILAVEKQVAFISCEAFTSAKKIPGTVTLIRWFHNLFHKPLYTLDLRLLNSSLSMDTSFIHNGKHFPSPETEGRLYLDLNVDPIGLRIDPVHPEDAGEYKCRIDFKNWRSVSSSIDLDIIIPPKEAIIRDSTGKKCEGIIGPFQLGQTVSFTCESLGGQPKPKASWSSSARMYQRITSKYSVLSIPSLEREDQWSHYTCSVQNSNLTAIKSVTVIIELILPPLDLNINSNHRLPFTAGQEVKITCQSSGSYPKAHIVWIKEGETLAAEERITNNGNLTTSFINLIAEPSDNGKSVECIAINPELKNDALVRAFPLKVYYKPQVSIAILTNQSELSEGSNMTFLCAAKGNPIPSEITWTFDNQKIYNSSTFFIHYHRLYINYLTKDHSGTYTCIATNDKGKASESVTVNVRHKPVCQRTEISYTYGQKNDDLNVTCYLDSYPSDVTFYWMLRNFSSNHSWSTGQNPHTRVELLKSNSKLLCWGRNEIGVQITPCKILLVEDVKLSIAYLPILLIASCGIILFSIATFFVVRKYKSRYNLSSESSKEEPKELKGMHSVRLSSTKPLYGKFISLNIFSMWANDNKVCETVN